MKILKNSRSISRRDFIGTISGAAAISLIRLERAAGAELPALNYLASDYAGRLCYNENPLGPSPRAVQAILNEASLVHRYPDWFAESLISALARKYEFPTDRFLCGSGGTEILRLAALAFARPGTNVVAPNPSYSQFPGDAELFGCAVRYVNLDSEYGIDLQAMADHINNSTAAVCITNPNNPTGTIVGDSDLESFVNSIREEIVTVIDEAYLEYIARNNYRSAVDLVARGKNVVVVKTFSKVYGLAGARIGYAISSSANIAAMRRFQYIATVSRTSLEAAKAAINDSRHVSDTVTLAKEMKDYCFSQFNEMRLEYIPSDASFFMVDVGRNADYVRSALASRGYYVRTGWGMPQHLRVSTGSRDEMEKFILALREILFAMPQGNKPEPLKSVELFQATPNPFNSSTTIRIYLPQSQKARLEIFDIQGRLVNTLFDGDLGLGEHSFIWNGSKQVGNNIASGSYFYRLSSGDNVFIRKMLLIK